MLLLGVTAMSLLTTPMVIALTHRLIEGGPQQYAQLPTLAAGAGSKARTSGAAGSGTGGGGAQGAQGGGGGQGSCLEMRRLDT